MDPDDVESFLTVEGKTGAQLSSEMDKTRKLEFFKALNAKINFLEKVKFTGLESTHSRQVSIFFALIVQNTRQDTTLNVLLKIRVFSI